MKFRMKCDLCGGEFEGSVKVSYVSDFNEMVCEKCHKNGRIEDDVWQPTLKIVEGRKKRN